MFEHSQSPCIDLDNACGDDEQKSNKISATSRNLNTLYDVYYRKNDEIRAAQLKFCNEQKMFIEDSIASDVSLEKFSLAVVKQLVQQACLCDVTTGVKLDLDVDDVLSAAGLEDWQDEWRKAEREQSDKDADEVNQRLQPIDFDRLHQYLVATYSGDAGLRLLHQQQAKQLHAFLKLDEQDLKITKSGVVIERTHYLYKRSWTGTNTYQLQGDYASRWRKTCDAFIVLASRAHLDQFALDVHSLKNTITPYDDLSMPTTLQHGSIKLKLFKEKFQLTIPPYVAEQLQLYLGEFFSE